MTGELALRQFNEAKGREIIPITTWCFWKMRNLIVFDGYEGSDKEAIHVVSKMVAKVLRYQDMNPGAHIFGQESEGKNPPKTSRVVITNEMSCIDDGNFPIVMYFMEIQRNVRCRWQ